VFRCYVEQYSARKRDAAGLVVAGAWLVHEEDCKRFDRHWRHLLIRYGLPIRDPDAWSEIAKRQNDPASAGAVHRFATAAASGDRLGFVVAIRQETWGRFPQGMRRAIGSAETFCFLRLLRRVIDRLEEADDTSAISIMLRRDVDIPERRASAVASLFEMDSRAADRIALIGLVDPRRDCQFAATDLLVKTALATILAATTARADGRLLARTGMARLLPPLPDNAALENWDDACAERRLHSLEWDLPSRSSRRRPKR
jgi:hypothetical protein